MSLVVLEANEIPLSLIQWFSDQRPAGALARLLRTGRSGVTEATDTGIRELYPSQTWATLATGVPFEKHGIYWYGDPKPAAYPLYWQAAAMSRKVGIVNTLHSSPFDQQCDLPGLVFAVPDVFAPTDDARPTTLVPLQRFTRSMTSQNARAVRSRLPVGDYLSGARSLGGAGVRPRTIARLGQLAGGVAAGRIPKERLRTAQFMLMADVFERQLHAHLPDLAVFFTNHVAAAMHRYWPASFPHDWPEPPRSDDWIARFAGEIPAALDELDLVVGRLLDWCHAGDHTLVVVSSMGQEGGHDGDAVTERTLIVDDPVAFGSSLGLPPTSQVAAAMVPHVTYRLDDAEAGDEAERLRSLTIEGGTLTVDRSGAAVTVTYHLDELAGDDITIEGIPRSLAATGLKWVDVEEQKAGVHQPFGSLLISRPGPALPERPVDTRDIAPAVLSALRLEPLDHHVEPTFEI